MTWDRGKQGGEGYILRLLAPPPAPQHGLPQSGGLSGWKTVEQLPFGSFTESAEFTGLECRFDDGRGFCISFSSYIITTIVY